MLMAIISTQRAQSLHLLKVDMMRKTKTAFVFTIVEPIKQSRPGYRAPVFELKAFPSDRRLCVFFVLKEYLFRRKTKVTNVNKLLVSYQRPHQAVSVATISRWIRTVMKMAGIDTDIFKAHSVRAAVTSKAKACHVPVQEIMAKAGWSRPSTFSTFYDKKIVRDRFAETVLKL
jgi:hypothetical protein